MSKKQELTTAIKITEDYYEALYALFHRNIPKNLTLPLPPSYTPKDELEERAIKYEKKFVTIYNVYNPQMNLPYYASYFSWWKILDDQHWVRQQLLNHVCQVVIGLKTLKDRANLKTPPQPGQVGGKTNQDVNKSTPTAKLVVNGKTGEVIFDANPYNDLPPTPFKFLYALATTPSKPVLNDTFFSLTPRATKRDIKNISKHIRAITDRIPPLTPLIKNKPETGYYLDLPTEGVYIVQRNADIDRILK